MILGAFISLGIFFKTIIYMDHHFYVLFSSCISVFQTFSIHYYEQNKNYIQNLFKNNVIYYLEAYNLNSMINSCKIDSFDR